jgi:hypothetical protein
LRPLTDLRPKALCPVDNRPLVDLAIDRVARHAAAVAVNAHHQADQLLAHVEGRGVHVSVERPQALGTAGALGQLRPWIDGRGTLVCNADAWHRDNLDGFVAGWDGERVRMLVRHEPDRGDFGPWRYTGACLLPWAVVRELEPVPSGLYEVCWRQLHEQGALGFVASDVEHIDGGTPAAYLGANMAASGGRSVIGDGARVDGEVVRAVVWPGGVVAAGERLVDAIRAGVDVTLRPFISGPARVPSGHVSS